MLPSNLIISIDQLAEQLLLRAQEIPTPKSQIPKPSSVKKKSTTTTTVIPEAPTKIPTVKKPAHVAVTRTKDTRRTGPISPARILTPFNVLPQELNSLEQQRKLRQSQTSKKNKQRSNVTKETISPWQPTKNSSNESSPNNIFDSGPRTWKQNNSKTFIENSMQHDDMGHFIRLVGTSTQPMPEPSLMKHNSDVDYEDYKQEESPTKLGESSKENSSRSSEESSEESSEKDSKKNSESSESEEEHYSDDFED